MKKLLLMVCLLSVAAFYGYSQSLSLTTPQGTNISNSSITQTGTKDSLELITYIYVKNTGTHAINVYCKKIEVNMMDSVESYLCWAGGCYTSGTFVSPNSAPMAAGQTLTDFVGHYGTVTNKGFKSGESIIRWVFFNDADHNDSVYLTVKYTTYPLGVDEKNSGQGMLSNAWPNPADATATLNYSVPTGSQGTIIVRNMVGSTVQTESLSSGYGKININTASLNDGIYFCSLLLDGKISQTKKLVVRH